MFRLELFIPHFLTFDRVQPMFVPFYDFPETQCQDLVATLSILKSRIIHSSCIIHKKIWYYFPLYRHFLHSRNDANQSLHYRFFQGK